MTFSTARPPGQSLRRRTALLAAALLAAALQTWAGASPASEARREPVDLALIVGNNVSVHNVRDRLSFADDDAIRVAEEFRVLHPGGAHWLLLEPDEPANRARLEALDLAWEPPTRAAFDRSIDQIRARVEREKARGRQVNLHFYFAGHGEPGGALHLADGYLPSADLKSSLGTIGADVVIAILDGCYLGEVVRGRRSLPPPGSPGEFRKRPAWLGLIGATTVVPEPDIFRGGLLTRVALNGLRGLGDLDSDGIVTFTELGRYIQSQIDSIDVKVALPVSAPKATVVDLRRSPRGLVLERDLSPGRIEVRRAGTRELMAELYHDRGRRHDLHLPDGHYEVIRFLYPDLHKRVKKALEAGSRGDHVYPVALTRIEIGPQHKAIVDSTTPVRPGFVAPKSRSGPPMQLTGSTSLEQIWISETEERLMAEQRIPPPFPLLNRPGFSRWSFGMQLGNPLGGLQVGSGASNDPLLAPGFTPGGAIHLTRLAAVQFGSQGLLELGPTLQYEVSTQQQVYCGGSYDQPCLLERALLHQFRAGAVLAGSRSAPSWEFGLETSLSWSPGLLTDLRMRPVIDTSGRVSPQAHWRYLFLTDVVMELAASALVAVSSQLEFGPSFRTSLTFFNQLSPGRPVPQASVGLELRQRSGTWR